MEQSTTTEAASSPPSFMTEQKVDTARQKAEKSVTKEQAAQSDDENAMRVAAIAKAKTRIGELDEYLERIHNVVAKVLPELISNNPLGQSLDTFTALEITAEAFEKRTKALMGLLDTAREVHFPQRLDADESKTFTSSETGNRVTRTQRLFASILPDQTGEMLKRAYAWLRANELGPLIKETVNSSALSGAAKELMENGKEMPDDIFRFHYKDGVSITKAKGAKGR